ncbi:hypothetical protein PB01_16355 [Psychrobacillus glaciei]|uniref:DUF4825 domain-containing protein n=1 Tax=Psychrobacillus glaciei TaxID=2283160 RepID=A0A5J6STK0_9BACI|nr:hypothetical protein PB01_16355 [Psychrobacillus glaciei]
MYVHKIFNSLLLIALISVTMLISACSSKSNTEEVQTEEILAYLTNYDEKTKSLTFDEIEWIDQSDTGRIKELGLDPESDFPSGFRVYNESEQTKSLKVSDDVEIDVVNGANLQEPLIIDIQELAKHIQVYKPLFYLTINNNVIIKMSEKYTP